MAVDVTNDHIGIGIVQGMSVIERELSIWRYVDRSESDTANVDGGYIDIVVLGQ